MPPASARFVLFPRRSTNPRVFPQFHQHKELGTICCYVFFFWGGWSRPKGSQITFHLSHLATCAPNITLRRVIPTMAFQGIYADMLPNILSDIYSDILSAILSGILSRIYSGILSDIYSDICSDILSVRAQAQPRNSCRRSPQCPELAIWGLAGITLILNLLFGSSGEHCDLAIAVEVRRRRRRRRRSRKRRRRRDSWHKI